MMREFWVVYDSQEKNFTQIPELFLNQPLAEKYGKPFKVRELTPNPPEVSEAAIAIDADEVNASFAAPFSGMKEMYALRKGLEIGFELGAQFVRHSAHAEAGRKE